jgi:hypothetical protein
MGQIARRRKIRKNEMRVRKERTAHNSIEVTDSTEEAVCKSVGIARIQPVNKPFERTLSHRSQLCASVKSTVVCFRTSSSL